MNTTKSAKKKFFNVVSLTSRGANCLNRDDSNMVKTIEFGGTPRLAISAQCLNYATLYGDDYKNYFCDETHPMGALRSIKIANSEKAAKQLKKNQVFIESLKEMAVSNGFDRAFQGMYGIELSNEILFMVFEYTQRLESDKDNLVVNWEIEEILSAMETVLKALTSPEEEMAKIRKGGFDLDYIKNAIKKEPSNKDISKKAIKGAIKKDLNGKCVYSMDTANRGRMCTGGLLDNVRGAQSCSTSFTVNAATGQVDYFTASDDFPSEDHAGAAHINTKDFGTGLYYGGDVYDMNLFLKNRGAERDENKDNKDFLRQEFKNQGYAIAAKLQATPSGRQGLTASYSLPSYVMVTFGSRPATLESAFEFPVPASEKGYLPESIKRLEDLWIRRSQAYGCDDDVAVFTMYPEQSDLIKEGLAHKCETLDELIAWVESRSEGFSYQTSVSA